MHAPEGDLGGRSKVLPKGKKKKVTYIRILKKTIPFQAKANTLCP